MVMTEHTLLFFTYSASRARSAHLTDQVVAHGKKFGGKVRKQECSSLKTAIPRMYKKIYYREGLTSQMCSRRRRLIMVVKSQSITMAKKRLIEPFMRGRLLSLFNQQPLTVKVHVVRKDNNGRTTKKICTGGSKET
jgi:hypothetical protein